MFPREPLFEEGVDRELTESFPEKVGQFSGNVLIGLSDLGTADLEKRTKSVAISLKNFH